MKNIHLLPTTKEQHSIIQKNSGLLLVQTPSKDYSGKKLNLYITSDEEIKEDDWGLSKLNEVILFGRSYNEKFYKKITLTTDQDLINEGVQAIDDEFLEWFIKNPSCDCIEIQKWFDGVDFLEYKIIIPQEEPKQDSTLENAKLALREYLLTNKEKVTEDLQEMREKSDSGRDETLEEAAENFANSKEWINGGASNWVQFSFKKGAKWQSERMYSEEEVQNILIEYVKTNPTKPYRVVNWFEQFKKK